MIKTCLVSLGCEKNLVDSEIILGMLAKGGFKIYPNKEGADLIIINTCGFIESAKQEAIDEILDSLDYKEDGAKIVVTGCLAQRYFDELKSELPEVDLFIPIRDYYRFGELLADLFKEAKYHDLCFDAMNRFVSTPKHLAYVRISEGCNNRCTYCAIPLIRGSFISRPEEDVLKEIEMLVKEGRYEICLISQDLTRYGSDLGTTSLASLIHKASQIEGNFKIRLLYLYPDEITDELISEVAANPKVMNYFDIPLQHISTHILRDMHRRGDEAFVRELIGKIRTNMPDAIIRTTMIVGFPGETEDDQKQLLKFVQDIGFNHLGAFTYSKEEDTPAFDLPNQIAEDIKFKRYNELMETQKFISMHKNEEFIGKTYECVIEEFDGEFYHGRGYMFAPDDIDGTIFITSSKELEIGNVYDVKIIDREFYDLIGIVDEGL